MGSYTKEQVAKHNTDKDCWLIINGDILDVTKYQNEHPGGALALNAFAGTDCSLEYNTVHEKELIQQHKDLIVGKLCQGFTKEQVAKHDNDDDCWVIINGQVYDVTKYQNEHPGGSLALSAFAGKDCSLEFNTVHEKDMLKDYQQYLVGSLVDAISMDEVAQHNTDDDCWLVIDGKVYDVTSFEKEHPGGIMALTAFAGTDCSLEFNTCHEHSILDKDGAKYLIGDLKSKNKKSAAPAANAKRLTMEEVAKHNTKDDCWVVVNGYVMNVTKFLPEHPGGEAAIVKFAGKDASNTFNSIHRPEVLQQYGGKYIVGKLGDAMAGSSSTGGVKLTMDEVAKHTTKDDCWIVVNGMVYNVTEWLPKHPGGPEIILQHAGQDASTDWNAIHPKDTMEKYGKPYELGALGSTIGGEAQPSTPALTMDEVAKHTTKDDCWIVVNGMVYNVTEWLPKHPGGPDVILQHAGQDASDDWNAIHPKGTMEKYGKPYELGPLGSGGSVSAPAPAGYTEEEVAKHTTKDDCWIIVNGMVYNVTDWLPKHPGGEAVILQYAGKDASDEWNMIHPAGTMEKYGKPYELGPLASAAAAAAPATGAAPAGGKVLSAEEVAKHNTDKDCWMIIDDGVYDLTDWAPIHPGGAAAIMSYAGKDGSTQFNMIHDSKTLSTIGKKYYLGPLNSVMGGGSSAAAGAVSNDLSTPLLSEEQWWGPDRNTAKQFGPLGPAVGYTVYEWCAAFCYFVWLFLYEVFATIFSVKNFKHPYDKTGVTRPAMFMCVFVVIHALGNIHLFFGAVHFNAYAYFLNHPFVWGTLMLPVEIYLLLAGLMHVVVALMRTFKFKNIHMPLDQLWMPITGIFLLIFLIVHLSQLRFVRESHAPIYRFRAKWMYPFYCAEDDLSCPVVEFKDLYLMTKEMFTSFGWVIFYLCGVCFFIAHLGQGLEKVIMMHHTIPRSQKHRVAVLGQLLTWIIGLLYLSYPIFCYFTPVRNLSAYEAAQPDAVSNSA
ncbi:hypothetical protein FOL47_005066 [Perkinsus chesapeaki]|uniref:Cytochrome b5 heme-binding domain-containing protein n=1 Tax=Perkinsus chesapeaki TaxID=330153 RepID=A0A7J6LZ66_PERCH|nr:hypothetical protein FOL47_005066 [Perkinsus chesapeaki]